MPLHRFGFSPTCHEKRLHQSAICANLPSSNKELKQTDTCVHSDIQNIRKWYNTVRFSDALAHSLAFLPLLSKVPREVSSGFLISARWIRGGGGSQPCEPLYRSFRPISALLLLHRFCGRCNTEKNVGTWDKPQFNSVMSGFEPGNKNNVWIGTSSESLFEAKKVAGSGFAGLRIGIKETRAPVLILVSWLFCSRQSMIQEGMAN